MMALGLLLLHSMSNSSSEICSCSGSNSVGVSESVHMFSDCRANNAAATILLVAVVGSM
jgi:hypothetical protein